MYKNKLSRMMEILALTLVFIVCMSGCGNGKSDTGETTSEMTSKSEYSEISSEKSSVNEKSENESPENKSEPVSSESSIAKVIF